MVYPTEFRSGGIGIALSIGKIGSVAGPVIGGLLLSMHLPITRLFYVATVPFIVVSVFSIMLAVLYRTKFGQDHATGGGTRNGLRQSSALGDS
jgi:AAHS family 4-hydroxybenzoate transporter-like MFS transporter